MKKLLFGTAMTVVLMAGAVANAADMPIQKAAPAPAAPTWNGIYLGWSIGQKRVDPN